MTRRPRSLTHHGVGTASTPDRTMTEARDMDERAFDRLSRQAGRARGRRQLLAALVGGAAAGLGVLPGRAAAKRRAQGGDPDGNGHGRCGRLGEACPDETGQLHCTSLAQDAQNCGACGVTCTIEGERCCAGICQVCEHCPCCDPSDFATCTCLNLPPGAPYLGVGHYCETGPGKPA
jgi:hypothetical protein